MAERKTIEEIRAEDNPFGYEQALGIHPGLYRVTREKGALPSDLKGTYTSEEKVKEAINTYLQGTRTEQRKKVSS